jgi:hypothetical protein
MTWDDVKAITDHQIDDLLLTLDGICHDFLDKTDGLPMSSTAAMAEMRGAIRAAIVSWATPEK